MTREEWLLDANVLIALTHAAHVRHHEAHAWFAAIPGRSFATCALTQLAFVRRSSNPRVAGVTITPAQAMRALGELTAHSGHIYWPDAPEPLQLATLNNAALVGHRQLADAYLLGLAAQRKRRLATLDRGLVSYAGSLQSQAHVELVTARSQTDVQEPKAAERTKRRQARERR